METNCPLCGHQKSSLFDQRKFRGQKVTNRKCKNCGLVFQWPHRSEEELASYYAREYRQEYQGAEGPNAKDLATQAERANSLYQFLKDKVGIVKRHLDIGCSAGLLLSKIQEVYQNESIGIEPGVAYRSYAQARGLTVYPSFSELDQSKHGQFDLISMAHVLEHLSKPVKYLSHLHKTLLAKDGHLLIEVPNLYAHDCFETAHVVSFSPHTLEQTLIKAGFAIDALEIHGRPRSAAIPLYLTMLAHPTDRAGKLDYIVKPERLVTLRRKLGMLQRKIVTRLKPDKAWLQPESFITQETQES